jgi:hypothetical protein
MQMLKARPATISAVYCLFPTLSHLAATTNGLRISPALNRFAIIFVAFVAQVLSLLLPVSLLSLLVGIVARIPRPDHRAVLASFIARPACGAAALGLAADEMQRIGELDAATLKRYGDRVSFYWAEGDTDGWVRDTSVREIVDVLERADARGERVARRVRCVRVSLANMHVNLIGRIDATSRSPTRFRSDPPM